MKKNYLILLTLLVALFSWSLIACEGGDDGDEKENSTDPGNSTQPGKKDYLDYIDLKRDGGIAKWEFGTSPATSLLYHIETVNGEHFVVEARKDANGVPTSLLSLIVQTKGENPEVSEILFDEQNRPVDVVAPNGVRILYEWLTDTKAAVTFIDPETDEQLNTVYDFALGEDQQTPKAPKAQMKREGEATLTVTPLSDRPAPVRAKAATGDRQGTIVLSSCGVGTPGQQCWVKVYDQGTYGHWATESSGYRGSYEAVWQSGGTYVYTLPSIENQPAIAEFLNIAGPKIKSLIDKMCLPNMAGGTYTDPMTAEMVFGVCLMVIKYTAITLQYPQQGSIFSRPQCSVCPGFAACQRHDRRYLRKVVEQSGGETGNLWRSNRCVDMSARLGWSPHELWLHYGKRIVRPLACGGDSNQ